MISKSNNYGEELKLLRVNAKVRAKDIALRLKKSSSWVSKMEKGEIDISEELYNEVKGYYSTKIEQNNIIEKNKYLKTIKFLSEENKKLRELLLLYIPTTEKELNNILEKTETQKKDISFDFTSEEMNEEFIEDVNSVLDQLD